MADRSNDPEASHWLVEPGPGEAFIHVAVGEEAEVTPALRAALESLASALKQEEVAGYAKKLPCPGLHVCSPQDSCSPRTQQPCVNYDSCRISN